MSNEWCDGYLHHFSWSDDSYSQGHTTSPCPGPDKCRYKKSKLTREEVMQRDIDKTIPKEMLKLRKNLKNG